MTPELMDQGAQRIATLQEAQMRQAFQYQPVIPRVPFIR